VSTPAVTHQPASGSAFPFGATIVTATATDAAGNAGSCAFTVTVRDTTGPTIVCPAAQTAEATSGAGATVSYPAATTTDVASIPALAYSNVTGSAFPLGATIVTATATDAAGNASTCTFAVAVRDTTAPAITCPPDQSATAPGKDGVAVWYPDATATDAVSTPTVTYSQASGSLYPAGDTPVTATATDAAGNAGSCTFTVSVTQPRGCGCQSSGSELSLWGLVAASAMALRRRKPPLSGARGS
jgi:hypothetical protein